MNQIEMRYFTKDGHVTGLNTSLEKLTTKTIGKKLALLARQNVIHNHPLKLDLGSPRFTVRNGEDNHPPGRKSFLCKKKYTHGKEHGRYKCTVPKELMCLNLLVEVDPSQLGGIESMKHYIGSRRHFSIPLDELYESSMFGTIAMWLEDQVFQYKINLPVKRSTGNDGMEKQLETSLIKDLVEEAQEKYIGGKMKDTDDLVSALSYVKKFRLVFSIK